MSCYAVMNALLRPGLSPTESRLYAYFVFRANGEKVCWPTVPDMELHLGAERKTIMSATRRLSKLGLIRIQRRFADCNRYHIIEQPGMEDIPRFPTAGCVQPRVNDSDKNGTKDAAHKSEERDISGDKNGTIEVTKTGQDSSNKNLTISNKETSSPAPAREREADAMMSSGLFDDLPDVPDEPPAPPPAPPMQTKRDPKPRARKPKPLRLRKDGTLADCTVPKCVREKDAQFFEVYGLFPIRDTKPFAAGHEWDRLMAEGVDPALIVEGVRDRDWLREFRHRPRDMWPGLTRWLRDGGWCAERKLDDNDDLAAIFGVTSPSSSSEPPALIALVDGRSLVR